MDLESIKTQKEEFHTKDCEEMAIIMGGGKFLCRIKVNIPGFFRMGN